MTRGAVLVAACLGVVIGAAAIASTMAGAWLFAILSVGLVGSAIVDWFEYDTTTARPNKESTT